MPEGAAVAAALLEVYRLRVVQPRLREVGHAPHLDGTFRMRRSMDRA